MWEFEKNNIFLMKAGLPCKQDKSLVASSNLETRRVIVLATGWAMRSQAAVGEIIETGSQPRHPFVCEHEVNEAGASGTSYQGSLKV